jgi:hypothetical protein
MYWDRFDICEAAWCYAHDYGLYHVINRLDRMTYKPGLFVSTDNLNENAKAFYESFVERRLWDD